MKLTSKASSPSPFHPAAVPGESPGSLIDQFLLRFPPSTYVTSSTVFLDSTTSTLVSIFDDTDFDSRDSCVTTQLLNAADSDAHMLSDEAMHENHE